ncbi:protein ROOT PRIMORDIUM DEFECTIVE 1 [Aristolochia californica]|uniref:protein ROOT PRIMORDIUM DEFECTIVE 1 n=1 Tax=Aristolochia californica TaxID=171875 RepID=UPI0035E2F355
MVDLMKEEAKVIEETEVLAVQRVKKLLMISTSGTLHIHSLWLVRRELGLPDDFRHSVLPKYSEDFRIVNSEIVALVSRDESLAVEEVEKWREKEYREKWLSEYETKFAFPINFPTGFKIEKGFREKLKNWQRLRYFKPYERLESVRPHSCGGVERFEKHVVGVIHEFLSLTVEKMVEVERLSHFRKDFSIETNMRELLLKHPGIFYISTKGCTQTVFLREAFHKGCLIEPNQVCAVRRKMLDLIVLGCRSSRNLLDIAGMKESSSDSESVGLHDGDWLIPISESFDSQNVEIENESSGTSNEEAGRSSNNGRL